MKKISLVFAAFFALACVQTARSWSWDSGDSTLPSLREELDHEIATYRQRVDAGLSTTDRLAILDRLINTYQPMGLSVAELDAERARLHLEESQQMLKATESQDQATKLTDKATFEYRAGRYKEALSILTEAARLSPADASVAALRKKMAAVASALPSEEGTDRGSDILRLAITHYLENDSRRAMNALVYARDKGVAAADVDRLQRMVVADNPDLENLGVPAGMTIVDHKLQLTLEAIYEGRYVTAVKECADVLDLEPQNVVALTRLGSSYFAMNERDKAKQVWTKALQLDPKNDVLRKFLYGAQGPRVETH